MRNSSPGRSKCLIVIQDGLADRPIESLGWKTPLEAARTPVMDRLVRQGVAGIMDIVAPGVRVGTDIGHLALFGQEIRPSVFTRGPMEAAGSGLTLRPGDVALRFNLATVDADLTILDRRAGRIRQRGPELVESLNRISVEPGIGLTFRCATEHRGVLLLSGPDISPEVTDSDPGRTGVRPLKIFPRSDRVEARRTAQILNEVLEKARHILADHPVNELLRREGKVPANCLLLRGAGTLQPYTNLPARLGLSVACVGGEATVLGIARLAGADTFSADGITANLDTDLSQKSRLTLEALKTHDLVYLHLKGCDIAGHDHQPELKRWFIEQTDAMLGDILESVGKPRSLYFAFVSDHATPCCLGEHSGDPVPVFISGLDVLTDGVTSYGERTCTSGGLGRLRCRGFLNTLFDYLGADGPPIGVEEYFSSGR